MVSPRTPKYKRNRPSRGGNDLAVRRTRNNLRMVDGVDQIRFSELIDSDDDDGEESEENGDAFRYIHGFGSKQRLGEEYEDGNDNDEDVDYESPTTGTLRSEEELVASAMAAFKRAEASDNGTVELDEEEWLAWERHLAREERRLKRQQRALQEARNRTMGKAKKSSPRSKHSEKRSSSNPSSSIPASNLLPELYQSDFAASASSLSVPREPRSHVTSTSSTPPYPMDYAPYRQSYNPAPITTHQYTHPYFVPSGPLGPTSGYTQGYDQHQPRRRPRYDYTDELSDNDIISSEHTGIGRHSYR